MDDLTTYPEPQQYYKVNMAALTWPELFRASGNPLSFLLALPVLAVAKLFRIPMTATVIPREITFRPLSHPLPPLAAQKMQGIVDGMQALGFRPFTTFEAPEMPYRNAIFALAHESGTAFADVTYLPVRNLHYSEFVSRFHDDCSLTTSNNSGGTAIQTPPGKLGQYVRTRDPAVLWERHQSLAGELALTHGGLKTDLDETTFFTSFRRAIRGYAIFQEGRGVFVPTPPPISAPGQWQK